MKWKKVLSCFLQLELIKIWIKTEKIHPWREIDSWPFELWPKLKREFELWPITLETGFWVIVRRRSDRSNWMIESSSEESMIESMIESFKRVHDRVHDQEEQVHDRVHDRVPQERERNRIESESFLEVKSHETKAPWERVKEPNWIRIVPDTKVHEPQAKAPWA